ncbi:MAG: cobyrinate a,c-diamide synthase [Zetaproteobacteria bacterium]|nr:MAG: cobyrinate a,c-diamide synthase [Zetaproteobacteria bacterium]
MIIAGTHSGVGKTSVALAILQQAQRQGIRLAPFKAGPDFLDPFWLAAAAGRPCRQLDAWMQNDAGMRAQLAQSQDPPLIEGVMGLFDGPNGGATAQIACATGLVVALVVDASGMAESIAAIAQGFARHDPDLRFVGVIANRVGGKTHAAILARALQDAGLKLLGWMDAEAPRIPERHLGLAPPARALPPLGAHLHLDEAFWSLCKPARIKAPAQSASRMLQGVRVAVARDAALGFIYQGNLDWLAEEGADIRFFSPLAGEDLPSADALWLPGGYPELFAAELSRSPTLRAIAEAIRGGMPALAECGGMMILGEAIVDADGRGFPMAGVLPARFVMRRRLVALGYRAWPHRGETLRGHEFHYADRQMRAPLPSAFAGIEGDSGVRIHRLWASFQHWWFASAPRFFARLFRGACR